MKKTGKNQKVEKLTEQELKDELTILGKRSYDLASEICKRNGVKTKSFIKNLVATAIDEFEKIKKDK